MTTRAAEILLAFPPRSLSPDERTMVADWLARAGDILVAYVSERRSDDPRLYRRVVIVAGPSEQPSHVIHAPSGNITWLVTSVAPPPRVEQFDTLRDALNSVRPVLAS